MTDLISRQAAIKAIDGLPNCYNGYSDTYDKAYIIGVLEELPTVEPKRGKWEPYMFGDERWHMCSECGIADKYGMKYKDFYGKENLVLAVRNYCPYCGARMEE